MEYSIDTERVYISVQDQQSASMAAYLAYPKQPGSYPGVILFMEIFGINSHMKEVAERIAKQGYVVVIPDYFHRTMPGVELAYDKAGMEQGMAALSKLKRAELIQDIAATIAYMKHRVDVTPRFGVVGFCIGGHVAYLASTQFEMDATVSFYGGGIAVGGMLGVSEPTVSLTSGMRKHHGKILCLFGGQDTMIPKDHRDQIEHALHTAGIRHEVVVYPQAGHAFFCDRKERGSFHQASHDDAWKRLLTLFQAELQKAGTTDFS